MFQRIKSFLFKNETSKQTVVKNTFWLSVTNFGGRAIKAIIVIYAARVLSTAGYGVLSYATTLAGFFTLFIDPGINAILTREVSKADDGERRRLLSTTFVIKIVVITSGVLFILLIAPFFSTLPGAKALLPIVALMIMFDSFREFFSSFMRAREKMEWETSVFLLTNVVITILGFLFLSIHKTAASFAWAYVAGTAMGTILAVWILRDYLKNIFSYFSAKLVMPIVRSAWPFAITGALGALLTSADILIISWMRNASDVGIYAAAVRIIQVLYLVPAIFQFSTLPLIARLARRDDVRFRKIFERTLSVVFLASVPLAVGGIVLGASIMHLVYGAAYASGALSFQLLMLTLLFDFPFTIVSAGVFAYDHQKSLIISSAIGGVANVILDLIFIPRFGIAGSAVATLIAQGTSNWYLWHIMKRINYFSVLPHLGRVALSGLLMGVLAFILSSIGLNVLINIAISGIAYFAILKLTREPLINELVNAVAPQSA